MYPAYDQEQGKKLRVTEDQRRLNAQSCRVTYTNIRTLLAKDEAQSLGLQDYPHL